jgi:hypothetical protein
VIYGRRCCNGAADSLEVSKIETPWFLLGQAPIFPPVSFGRFGHFFGRIAKPRGFPILEIAENLCSPAAGAEVNLGGLARDKSSRPLGNGREARLPQTAVTGFPAHYFVHKVAIRQSFFDSAPGGGWKSMSHGGTYKSEKAAKLAHTSRNLSCRGAGGSQQPPVPACTPQLIQHKVADHHAGGACPDECRGRGRESPKTCWKAGDRDSVA